MNIEVNLEAAMVQATEYLYIVRDDEILSNTVRFRNEN